ncbi:MAG: ABC transporter substrate-binding protein, partial [Anaerolineales bacterium]|nr:ABC transporter substrate-binding protein [Anaerolineales bacterium]
MKRLSILALVVLLLGIFLSACQPAGPTTIKIGLNAELTGSIPVVGESCRNAAELAVKEINDAGGLEVGGQKYMIELLVEDNEDKAESAAAATQKLVTANVLAMIGPNASRNAIPSSVV